MHATTYALDSTWRPLLKDLGVSMGRVLRRAGLSDELLHRPGVRLSARDFHRFWDGIDAEMADPLLPLKLCQTVRSESFSAPLFAALCSPNGLVALQRIARYKALVAPMRLDIRPARDRVSVDLVWLDHASAPPLSLVLTELLFVVALLRMGTREAVQPLAVITRTPPKESSAYARFLGVPVEKGTRHRVIMSRSDAMLPFLTSNEGLWAAFEPELRTRLAQLDASVTLVERVRSVLLEALPGGGVDMAGVAQTLGMSGRSLQRHLTSQGVRYTDLLQATRHALAQHYLAKTQLPASEIAYLLGFAEPNSFFRAFRLWSGQSPECYRQALAASPSPGQALAQRTAPPTFCRSRS